MKNAMPSFTWRIVRRTKIDPIVLSYLGKPFKSKHGEWEQFWTASSLSCLIERRRLGTERKFSQQAWQVTSHLTSPRTTENKADFSTLYDSLQDFTGKEVGVKVSLTLNK